MERRSRPRCSRQCAARRAAVGEVKGERSEPFTSQQDLKAVVMPKGFEGWSTRSRRKKPAAKRPERGPKGRAWRVKAERSEAFTSQKTCKQRSSQS